MDRLNRLTTCMWNDQNRCIAEVLWALIAVSGICIGFYCFIGNLASLTGEDFKTQMALTKLYNQIKKADQIILKKYKFKIIDDDTAEENIDEVTETKAIFIVSACLGPLKLAFFIINLLIALKLKFDAKSKDRMRMLFMVNFILSGILFAIDLGVLIWLSSSNSDDDTKSFYKDAIKWMMIPTNYEKKKIRQIITDIQVDYKCCGWDIFSDWGFASDSKSTYSIPLSCCDLHSLEPCVYKNLKKSSVKSKVTSIYDQGCSEPLIKKLRKVVKLPILTGSLLTLLFSLVMAVITRLYCTHLDNLKEIEDFPRERYSAYIFSAYNSIDSSRNSEIKEEGDGGTDYGSERNLGKSKSKKINGFKSKKLGPSKMPKGGNKMIKKVPQLKKVNKLQKLTKLIN